MIVEVTQEDIDKASVISDKPAGLSCPIARALHREYPIAWVSTHHWTPTPERWRKAIPLSRSAQRFIRAFDQGKSVKPFRFRTETP